MYPSHRPGDLVVIADIPPYRFGTVVAYQDPSTGVEVLHRIVGGDATGFVVRGDNNTSVDPYTPSLAELRGREIFSVPAFGRFATAPVFLPAVIVIAVAAAAAVRRIASRRAAKRTQRTADTAGPPGDGSVSDTEPGRGSGGADGQADLSAAGDSTSSGPAAVVTLSWSDLADIDPYTVDLDSFDWWGTGRPAKPGDELPVPHEVWPPVDDLTGAHRSPGAMPPDVQVCDTCTADVSGVSASVAAQLERTGVACTVAGPLSSGGPTGASFIVTVEASRRRRWTAFVPAFALIAVTFATSTAAAVSLLGAASGDVPTGERGVLRYAASVESGATYPTGEVRTGDSVFLRLVDELELVYEHYPAPGQALPTSVNFEATMSTPGWQRTIQLPPPVIATGSDRAAPFTATTTFDTTAPFALLTAMADETGVRYGSATVSISVGPPGSSQPATIEFKSTEDTLSLEDVNGAAQGDAENGVVAEFTEHVDPDALVPREWLRVLALAAVVAMMLAALAWPSAANGPSLPKSATLTALPDLHIFAGDRATLDELSSRLGEPVVSSPDGWSAVVLADRLYWARDTEG